MFNRDDLPGFLFLTLCAVVAIALLIEIFTDYTFRFSGPNCEPSEPGPAVIVMHRPPMPPLPSPLTGPISRLDDGHADPAPLPG
jgi:hypothetical protein